MVSPGMWKVTDDWLSFKPLTAMTHGMGVLVVSSSDVLSVMAMSTLALSMMTSLMLALVWLRLTPATGESDVSCESLVRSRRPTCPFTTVSAMKSSVLKTALFTSRAFTLTSLSSKGRSFTSTTAFSMSAMVSSFWGSCVFCLRHRTLLRLRLRGKESLTSSMLIFMPVVSDAYLLAVCTAQFCMGGR